MISPLDGRKLPANTEDHATDDTDENNTDYQTTSYGPHKWRLRYYVPDIDAAYSCSSTRAIGNLENLFTGHTAFDVGIGMLRDRVH